MPLELLRIEGYDPSVGARDRFQTTVDESGRWTVDVDPLGATHIVQIQSVGAELRSARDDVRSLGHGLWLLTRSRAPGAMDLELSPRDSALDLSITNLAGRPVHGARVRSADGKELASSDRAGICKLRVSSHVAECRVWVRGAGYEPYELVTEPPASGASRVERVRLEDALRLQGIVEDAAGVPIRDARVSIVEYPKVGVAHSDIQGRLSLSWAPFLDRALRLRVEAEGYVRAFHWMQRHEVEDPVRPHVLRLRRGLEIRGRVLEDFAAEDDAAEGPRRAVRGARLSVVSDPRAHEAQEAISDDEGRFVFRALPVGESVVLCRAPDRPPFLATLQIPKSAEARLRRAPDVQILIPAAKELRGQVVIGPKRDGAGIGIAGAELRVLQSISSKEGFEVEIARGVSADSGAFHFQSLPATDLRIEVRHPEHAKGHFDAAAGQAVVQLALKRAMRASLRVVGARSGQPIREFTVDLHDRAELLRPRTWASSDASRGRARPRLTHYEIRSEDGMWQSSALDGPLAFATVYARGFAQKTVSLRSGGSPQRVALQVAAGLHGRVISAADGSPVRRARVRVVPARWRRHRDSSSFEASIVQVETDARGDFSLPHTPPGGVYMRVEHPGFRPWESQLLTLKSGEARRLGVTLRTGSRVRARLFAEGHPLSAGHAILTRKDRAARNEARAWSTPIGSDGRFSLEPRLDDGRWLIHTLARDAEGNYVATRTSLDVSREKPWHPPGELRIDAQAGHAARIILQVDGDPSIDPRQRLPVEFWFDDRRFLLTLERATRESFVLALRGLMVRHVMIRTKTIRGTTRAQRFLIRPGLTSQVLDLRRD